MIDANTQREATAWTWNRLWDAGTATWLESPRETDDWSEFEMILPDGTKATVRVEVHG